MPLRTLATSSRQDDAAMTPAARPPERLLALLKLVERTVLPRKAHLVGGGTEVTLDLATQRLQLGVQSGSHFVIDDTLAASAPEAHKLLRRRERSVSRHDETLRINRTALCACAARALLHLCANGGVRHRVEAAPLEEVWALASFSVIELYEAARDQATQLGRGPVRGFFDTVRPKIDEAWLLSQDGWVIEAPEDARGLDQYAEMTRTARQLGEWRGDSIALPHLAYATRSPHEWIWAVASDVHHIAVLRCQPLKWSATLSAWNDTAASADAAPGS